jgi:hypothetical protein
VSFFSNASVGAASARIQTMIDATATHPLSWPAPSSIRKWAGHPEIVERGPGWPGPSSIKRGPHDNSVQRPRVVPSSQVWPAIRVTVDVDPMSSLTSQ